MVGVLYGVLREGSGLAASLPVAGRALQGGGHLAWANSAARTEGWLMSRKVGARHPRLLVAGECVYREVRDVLGLLVVGARAVPASPERFAGCRRWSN